MNCHAWLITNFGQFLSKGGTLIKKKLKIISQLSMAIHTPIESPQNLPRRSDITVKIMILSRYRYRYDFLKAFF